MSDAETPPPHAAGSMPVSLDLFVGLYRTEKPERFQSVFASHLAWATEQEAAGYDPDQIASQTLRAGFLTEAARRGANIFKIREQSRHRSLEVLSDYVRHELFADHAGERFL